DRVAVMYAGRVVEMGTRDAIFAAPRHPYTRALLDSVPRFDGTDDRHLPTIEGSPPVAGRLGAGCAFRPRCGFASEACGEEPPARRDGGRRWRCHHPLEGEP
ncbi:MAG: oligopeptide/dipeptide ABC transporter ATP-binding protein, partial [Myxococcota bacterium]